MIHQPTIILCPERLTIDDSARVDSFCKLECAGGILIGKLVHVASFVHLGIGGGRVVLDDESAVSSGAKIVSGSAVPGPHGCSAVNPRVTNKRSFVVVKRRAIIFTNAVILPGVTIGEGAVIAAGAVERSDVPAWEVWGGVPARKLGEVPR